jgi:ATPase subunit of ABC transporter with duplicated ATPase domains
MINVCNVGLQFGGRKLFQEVNLSFTKGNCYGIIGANGAGKSTFLKVLSKQLEPTEGFVEIEKNARMSILKQNQNEFDNETVIKTVMLGHKRLIEIMDLKEELYCKDPFTDEDGILLGELENEFLELDGWEAESQASSLLQGLGIKEEFHYMLMKDLDAKMKVKVLLAQAIFGNPDILLLDEPTNNLDSFSTRWLENFLLNFENTVLIVSHDRHFLNNVCTHICDVDYKKIKLYQGNYEFWYETSQLALKQLKDVNKKKEQKIKELKEFIQRFSANLSKSKQATSRKKLLDKIEIEEIEPSTRRYPFIDFKVKREVGNEILFVENLTKLPYFENISFTLRRDEKVALLSTNTLVTTALLNILAGEDTDYTGTFKWGITTTQTYLPTDNSKYFQDEINLVEWVRNYCVEDQTETFVRGFLGQMLFSGEEALKNSNVLSGGEKVRLMMIKSMLNQGNILLLDDPTNHLDLESIQSLNQGLIRFRGNILMTSHDYELLNTVCNRVISIENKKIEKDFLGTYEEYIDLLESEQSKK